MPVILLIMLLAFIGNAEAGELWTKYALVDTVNCITSHGDYIWAGTNRGLIRLSRSDGSKKTYSANNGLLPANIVTSVCADNNGIIYAALIDSYRDKNGNLNAYFVSINGDIVTDYSEISGLRNNIFYPVGYTITNEKESFIVSSNNKLWLGVNLVLWPGDNGYKYMIAVIEFDGIKWSILFTQYAWYYGSNMNRIVIYNMFINPYDEYFSATVITDNSSGKLRNINYDKNGQWNTYFDSNRADYICNQDTISYTPENSGLTGKISEMAIDSNYKKWFYCYYFAGLVSFDNYEWKSYTADDWNFNTLMKAMTIDDDNCVWISTTRPQGLYRFNPNSNTAIETEQTTTPSAFTLTAAYPNPFNASTTISFTLNKPGKVNLAVYNLAGQKVKELATGNYSAGSHTAVWDSRDDNGNAVSSGVYLARMESGGVRNVVRMALVK